jgi:hypothetical protein
VLNPGSPVVIGRRKKLIKEAGRKAATGGI